MKPTHPAIAVIIPTLDRPAQLEGCLEALAEQTYPLDRVEVIVVNDGGAESLETRLSPFRERLDLRVIRQANQGPGAARNVGAAVARAPVFAFTDDDCRPAPDWIRSLVARFEQDPHRLYGGRVMNALHTNLYAVTSQLILELAYAHHNTSEGEVRFVASNNMAIGATGFRLVGGFDPRFSLAAEDRDLCARWRESGNKLGLVPEAVIHHAHNLTMAGFWSQHFGYGRGACRYHLALRRRGSAHLARSLPLQLAFVARAHRSLGDRPFGEVVRIWWRLLLWQMANTAGFAWEALATLAQTASVLRRSTGGWSSGAR